MFIVYLHIIYLSFLNLNIITYRISNDRVLLLAHSRIFFFSHPSTVLTHSSPGLRQSLEMNGIVMDLLLYHKSRNELLELKAAPSWFYFF